MRASRSRSSRGGTLECSEDYGTDFRTFRAERIDSKNTHGTGCTLSAAITAHLAKGRALEEAVGEAKGFITEAIRSAPADIGSGHGPLDHMCRLMRTEE